MWKTDTNRFPSYTSPSTGTCGITCENQTPPDLLPVSRKFSTVSTALRIGSLWKLLKTLFKCSIQLTYRKHRMWKKFTTNMF